MTIANDVEIIERTLEQLRKQETELASQAHKTQESIALYSRLLGYARLAQQSSNEPKE